MIAFCMLLTGCHMSHEWQKATCTQPMVCTVGGETKGEALGHTWTDATCIQAKTCSVCQETEGEALGHTVLSEATCEKAAICNICGEEIEKAKGHTWIQAGCTEPLVCSVCQLTVDAPGHIWAEATCTDPKTCMACQLTEGAALGHKTTDTDICDQCGEVVETAQPKSNISNTAPAGNAASGRDRDAEIAEWVKNPEFNTLERNIGYQTASPEEQARMKEIWDQYYGN